jgi:hypothetical protein
LQRLRTDHWRSLAELNIPVSKDLLNRLVINGWVEKHDQGRGFELKITSAGSDALKAKIPMTVPPRKAPATHAEADAIVTTALELPARLCTEVDMWATRRALTRAAALRRLVELGLKVKR